MHARPQASELNVAEALLETAAQIEWFVEAFGHTPLFINGHNHCHVAPALVEGMAKLCAARGIQHVRIPSEADNGQEGPGICPVCAQMGSYGHRARQAYSDAGLLAADAFVGLSFCGSHYSVEQFVGAVKSQISLAGVRSCEAMVHPGYCDPMDAFSESSDREQELSTLCNTRLRATLAKIVRLQPYLPLPGHPLHTPRGTAP